MRSGPRNALCPSAIPAGTTSLTPNPSEPPKTCALAVALATQLREAKTDLAEQWLERITARAALPADRVFPTRDLLDHVPRLITEIADYLEDPAQDVAGDTPVIAEAVQLGELRHRQGFDAHEILKEYEALGDILFHFLSEAATDLPQPCEPGDLLVTSKHLFRAISIIQQTTMTHFLGLADERVGEREDRLRAFNRMISHEIKNAIGAILGAADLLATLPDLEQGKRRHFADIIQRRAREMTATMNNLAALTQLDGEVREHRQIRLPRVAAEATRQLRDAATASNVDLRVSPELPDVEVNAPVVELALANYLSNAIKYARPADEEAYAEVSAKEIEGDSAHEVMVCVKDNGPGVPSEKRERLFQRFFRAHDGEKPVEGSGLGLSIVRETVESVGGRAWAEFPERGAVFCIALPMTPVSPSTGGGSAREAPRPEARASSEENPERGA